MPGPSLGSTGPVGGTAGHSFLYPGAEQAGALAGLPHPGVEQWFDLWSISKESSILLIGFKVMCALASSFPTLPLFLDTRVLY